MVKSMDISHTKTKILLLNVQRAGGVKMDYKETLNLPQTSFQMKANLVKKEPEMLKSWEEKEIYKKTLETRQGAPTYLLHDGPPYAMVISTLELR